MVLLRSKSAFYQVSHIENKIILNLLDVLIQNISETLPATLWHKNGVTIVAFHLRNGHVAPLLVLLDVKVEVLVLDANVFIFGTIHRIFCIPYSK